ncbi:MAG: nucleotidyltransferase domain-containing protein [Planctomycetes bacterium]|nr:nucleotidyltransferase domain-containing protein [Planctomycetota bacterium]
MNEQPSTGNAAPREHADRQLVDRIRAALAPREEILEAYLFGSQATGRAQPHSDVDVAVFVDAERATHSGFGYPAELTTALMAALRRNDVDVVVLNQADPVLYHRVLRDGVRVLARDLAATTTREAYAFSRYFDFLPQLAKMEATRRYVRERRG